MRVRACVNVCVPAGRVYVHTYMRTHSYMHAYVSVRVCLPACACVRGCVKLNLFYCVVRSPTAILLPDVSLSTTQIRATSEHPDCNGNVGKKLIRDCAV